MKNIRLVCAGLVAMLLVSSCGMMSDGFSGSSIQKRKYTNGFYFSKNKHYRGSDNKAVAEDLKSEQVEADEMIVPTPEVAVSVSSTEEQVQVVVAEKNPLPAQKDEEKSKDNKRKSGATPAKKVPAPQKQRKERVPEHYLPIKKDNVSRQNSSSSSSSSGDMFILAVIFAILIPPIGVAIYTNIDWMKVLICLLLTILFVLPGMIYALLVVFDVI